MSQPHSQPTNPSNMKRFLLAPGKLLLILGLVVGLLYCVFIPFGAGFDEETHVLRIYDLSGLHLLPNRGPDGKTVGFSEFFTLSYQRRFFESPAFDQFSREQFLQTPNYDSMSITETRSIYSPVIFLPQAVLAGVFWRFLDLPVIPVAILMRMAGLALYLAAAYAALRLLPLGKWVFLALALSPMALFQAATLNADGFTNAVSFLFIGLALNLYAHSSPSLSPDANQAYPLPSPRESGARSGAGTRVKLFALAVVILLLGLAKPGYIALLPLALILPWRRFQPKARTALIAAAALAVICTAGWMLLSVPDSHFASGGSQSLPRQAALALADPGGFVLAYITGMFRSILPYFRDWTAAYGYWVGRVPEPVYWFFPPALAAALLAEPRAKRFSWKVRLFMLAVFALSAGAVLMMFFLVHYEPGTNSDLGQQGRYFIPVAPLFFIPLAGLVSPQDWGRKAARCLSVGALVVTLGFYSLGLYATYYTECGYAQFAGQSCVLPVYKNIEKVGAPRVTLNAENPTASQQFNNTCGERLQAVDVLVNAVSGQAGTLRYSLLDSQGQALASTDVRLSEIAVQKPLALKLGGPAAHTGPYEIRLDASGLAQGESLGLALRPGDHYPGVLTAAGEQVDGDLIFQYVCENPFR